MIKDPKNYKLWVNSLEKQANEEELRSEKFARYLKDIEVEKSAEKKEALRQNINNVLTGISKFKALKQEETKIPKSNDDVCRAEF
jgi:hypothetical protein